MMFLLAPNVCQNSGQIFLRKRKYSKSILPRKVFCYPKLSVEKIRTASFQLSNNIADRKRRQNTDCCMNVILDSIDTKDIAPKFFRLIFKKRKENLFDLRRNIRLAQICSPYNVIEELVIDFAHMSPQVNDECLFRS